MIIKPLIYSSFIQHAHGNYKSLMPTKRVIDDCRAIYEKHLNKSMHADCRVQFSAVAADRTTHLAKSVALLFLFEFSQIAEKTY